MKLCMIGTGYVGLVSGACFSDLGNEVVCVDKDENKINNLKNSIIPIYEPGLDILVKENYNKETLHFTTDIEDVLSISEIVFIAVGTPMGKDGSADLKFVFGLF